MTWLASEPWYVWVLLAPPILWLGGVLAYLLFLFGVITHCEISDLFS